MKLSDAISIFGNKVRLARALGLTKGRISQLPEDLDLATSDRVVGAALRLGKELPTEWVGAADSTDQAA